MNEVKEIASPTKKTEVEVVKTEKEQKDDKIISKKREEEKT